MIEIDHVIVVVPDLERSAEQLLSEFGLSSAPGGRHEGHGTGNHIVPLGSDYLELMAVVDPTEAASSPMGRWATAHASADLMPAALCLRTDDIASIAADLGGAPEAMSRLKPDGSVLSWHLLGLEDMLGPDNLPFFIEWHGEMEDHPASTSVEHRVRVDGIAAVTIGPPGALQPLLVGVDRVTIASGLGVRQAVIGTSGGPVTLG